MQSRAAYDKIRIERNRAICPRCGHKLPGVFHPGCVVKGLTLQCRRCRTKVRIHIEATRDRASSVQ